MYYDPVRIEGPSLLRKTVYLYLIRTLLSVLDRPAKSTVITHDAAPDG